MKKILMAIAMALVLGMAVQSFAINNLQLGITGGSYIDETTVANSNTFDLIAYLLPNEENTLNDTYYLSAALIKTGYAAIAESAVSLGSFKIGNTTYNVTSSMNYGTPPVGEFYKNLPPHDIFPTYYTETSFGFNSNNVINPAINVAGTDTQNNNMYFNTFSIDLSGLALGYGIHFDLYNLSETSKPNGTFDISDAAPFSHDAEGWKKDTPDPHEVVPEPGTIALLGVGLTALGLMKRFRRA